MGMPVTTVTTTPMRPLRLPTRLRTRAITATPKPIMTITATTMAR